MPRNTWRRAYSYRVDRLPVYRVKIYTPISHDAPIGEEDAHFWDWVASAIAVVLIAAFVFLAIGWLT